MTRATGNQCVDYRTRSRPPSSCEPATLATSAVTRNLAGIPVRLYGPWPYPEHLSVAGMQDALTHRARLVRGPPGTGKSRTVRAIAVGAVLEALANNRLRVLVSAFTYTAIDNVLLEVGRDLSSARAGGVRRVPRPVTRPRPESPRQPSTSSLTVHSRRPP